jgi:hypothetical protein
MEDNLQNFKRVNEISVKALLITLITWYRYLLTKWLYIIAFGFIGGITGFTYAYLKKPIFTATTNFVLEDGEKSGGLGQYAGLASMVGIDLGTSGGGIFQGDNILELYKSRTMIQKTLLTEVDFKGIKKLLIDHYLDISDSRKNWSESEALKNISFKNESPLKVSKESFQLKRLRDSVLGSIAEKINKGYLSVSKPDKKLNIINVEVKSNDEFFAKLFNDQIVKNVNDFYVQTKTKKSIENILILQSKTDSVRAVLNGAIYSAAAISDETPNLNPTRQLQRIFPVQKSQITAETNKAVLAELVKNLEMAKISLRKETPLIQVIDYPIFPLTKYKQSKILTAILCSFVFGFLTACYFIGTYYLKNLNDEIKSLNTLNPLSK